MHRSTKARLALVTLLTLRRVSFPHPRLPELPVSDSLATGVSSQEIAPPDIAPAAEMPTGAVPAGDPTEAPDGSTYPENTPGRTDAYNALIRRVAAQHPGMVTVYDLNKGLSPRPSLLADHRRCHRSLKRWHSHLQGWGDVAAITDASRDRSAGPATPGNLTPGEPNARGT
jgi:hypothetical protein